MENKISWFGHRNRPSVRSSGDSAPSHLPRSDFASLLAEGTSQGAASEQGSALSTAPCPWAASSLHVPWGAATRTLLVVFPGWEEHLIFVSALFTMTKASLNKGEMVWHEAKGKG